MVSSAFGWAGEPPILHIFKICGNLLPLLDPPLLLGEGDLFIKERGFTPQKSGLLVRHTNSIEGFWSLLKRGIGGVYHSVSEKYLQSYINEYGFRYNHRKDEKPMFLTVLEKV